MKFCKWIFFLLSLQVFLNAAEKTLPNELIYKEKPIPEFHFFRFLWDPGIYKLNEKRKNEPIFDKITYEWEYLGSFYDKYHLIKTYYWEEGCIGKFTHLLLVRREDDKLEISDVIYGGDRHASMIHGAEIDGDRVLYSQGATRGGLMEYAIELFPEIKPLYERSSKQGLCYGEACVIGGYEFASHVTPDGKFEDREFLSFQVCEGEPNYSRGYQKEAFKDFALELLQSIDDHKPDELKENGIAFSPICFQKILEDDLRNIDVAPRSINLLTYKDTPFPFFSNFVWDYIGKIRKYHLIKASLRIEGDAFGIYTICKEGNTLRKIARIYHQKQQEDLIFCDTKIEEEVLTYTYKVSCLSLFNLFCEKFPELLSEANKKVWIDKDLPCGWVKMAFHLSEDGTLDKKNFIGFMSYDDPFREERELATHNQLLLPMDKALLFTGIEMSNPYTFDRLLSEEQLKDFFQTALKRAKESNPCS